jgi:hypothetical protein
VKLWSGAYRIKDMEYLSIIAEMMLENIKVLPSRKIDEKVMRIYGSIFFSITMILGIGLSSYYLIDSFRSGLLFLPYLLAGLEINAITALSAGFIIFQLRTWRTDIHIQESEEFIKSELRSLIEFFLISLIPGFHIIFLPRAVARAKSLMNSVDLIPEPDRYKKIIYNLIAVAAFLIMIYAQLLALALIIAGDTRR